jgi:predicted metal-dependent hydrolase
MNKAERGTLRIGSTLIPYVVERRTRRRKTVEVQFLEGGRLRVAAPATASRASVEAHLMGRTATIVRRLNGHTRTDPVPDREYINGETFEYLGRQARLRVITLAVPRATVRLVRGRLEVTVPRNQAGGRTDVVREALVRWYRERAARRLRERVDYFAPRLGVDPADVLVRSQERRWGSCSKDGIVRFNWRIVMAPAALIDYVVVHELCHLVDAEHDERFWRRVGAILPDYQLRRERLKRSGTRYTI